MISKEWYERKDIIMLTPETTLRIGKWNVGFIGYDWTTRAPHGARYMAMVLLPGVKNFQGHCATKVRAKKIIEDAVDYWFYHTENRDEEAVAVGRVRRSRPHSEDAQVRRVTRSRPVEDAATVGRIRRTR